VTNAASDGRTDGWLDRRRVDRKTRQVYFCSIVNICVQKWL